MINPVNLWGVAGIAFILGVILSALVIGAWSRLSIQKETEGLRIQLAEVHTVKNSLNIKIETITPELQSLRQENEGLKIDLARLDEQRASDEEKRNWLEQSQKQMEQVFESLAGRTLHSNSDLFMKHARNHADDFMKQMRHDWNTHRSDLQHLIDPVQQHLNLLDTHVRELEQKREGAYQGLTEQIRQLSQAQATLQTTTITLVQALKSPTVRGRWGEVQLRRVVELAGMTRHVSYDEQVGTDGGRPDMIVYLPNSGILPVDSKVPLESYLAAMEAIDEPSRKAGLAGHVKAIRNRVRELSQKKYWEQFHPAPEFVIMFIPNDVCLGSAFENDPDLLEYAVQQKVLLTTPITFIALLKAVVYGWQQFQLTENARQIAQQAQEMCRRLEIFVNHMGELGKHLRKTVEGYNHTVGSLEQRLIPIARKFQDSGGIRAEVNPPAPVNIPVNSPFNGLDRSEDNETRDRS